MSPYDILGIPPSASDEEVTRAYKALAKRYHPDLHPDDLSAADRMGRINRAYDDVKALRRRQESAAYRTYPGAGGARSGAADPFAGFEEYRRTYRAGYYERPRRNPMWFVLAVAVVSLLTRLLLNILFGGYGMYGTGTGMVREAPVPQAGYHEIYP